MSHSRHGIYFVENMIMIKIVASDILDNSFDGDKTIPRTKADKLPDVCLPNSFNMSITLNYLIYGDSSPLHQNFPMEIRKTKSFGTLKDLIKEKCSPELDHITAKNLELWMVDIPLDNPNVLLTALKADPMATIDTVLKGVNLPVAHKVQKYFSEPLDDGHIHIIVECPHASKRALPDVTPPLFQYVYLAFRPRYPTTPIHQTIYVKASTTRNNTNSKYVYLKICHMISAISSPSKCSRGAEDTGIHYQEYDDISDYPVIPRQDNKDSPAIVLRKRPLRVDYMIPDSPNTVVTDSSYILSSPYSDATVSKASNDSCMDYFIGPGIIEWNLDDYLSRWMIGKNDISSKCREY
ncbi:hypothetical protein BC938DRAFT_472569 [Jimgerdemannia flammicorona]|uniref:Crinkler effector protein N-terminal domain-containing protein n=1 Tax=Jimgerdemannia flammicorona TaxID=994334 RepID=A0A433QZU9_9FUNG|nr:hypothetical protein BC938DRAFT_472569 [Jimgerdemannia flammicorona]